MFLYLDKWKQNKTAVKDDSGYSLTYGELCNLIQDFCSLKLPRCVVFCLCENSVGSLLGYLAFENNGQVPLLLSAKMDKEMRERLADLYYPSYYWLPDRMCENALGQLIFRTCGYALIKTNNEVYPLHECLSLLLPTSGSTGSPKLVRHKYGNLEANAENVAKAFSWRSEEVGICDLPMNYTMGLNVINSHLTIGATVLMVKANMMDPSFWSFIKENKGTSFCGVPFSYEIMRRIGFDKMNLPNLYTLAEGGGKLTDKMFRWIASYAADNRKRFVATFGTSETSARISFLEPEKTMEKIGSIGKAIPNGELFLINEQLEAEGSTIGELGYRGPNVTMGYAVSMVDLQKGDEFNGEYHTGDIARRDKEGYYYIVGRKGRFLKLFGLRVSLDETERILKTKFQNADFVCLGNDKRMNIYTTDPSIIGQIIPFISKKTNIHNSAFNIIVVESIPRNEYGKALYAELEKEWLLW